MQISNSTLELADFSRRKDPGKITSNVPKQDREKLARLAEEFESVFIDTVFKTMRKTVPKSDFIERSAGEEIFRSMLDTEYAKEMAKQRTTGIAEQIEKDLLKALEIQSQGQQKQEGQRVYSDVDLHKQAKKAIIKSDGSS